MPKSPGVVRVFAEKWSRDRMRSLPDRKEGVESFQLGGESVCELVVFFFPFPRTSLWKAMHAKSRKGPFRLKLKGEGGDSDSSVSRGVMLPGVPPCSAKL